jgi:hypothetical protein
MILKIVPWFMMGILVAIGAVIVDRDANCESKPMNAAARLLDGSLR